MKRRVTAFAIMLLAVLLVKLGMPVLAEMIVPTAEGYTLTLGYIEGREAPVSALLTKDTPKDEAAPNVEWAYKEFPFTTPYGENGQVARAVVTMGTQREATDEQWQAMTGALTDLVSRAVPHAADLDVGELAQRMARAIDSAKRSGKPDEDGQLKLADDPAVVLTKLTVEAPYYPTLKRGDRNGDVQALQRQLIEMGYLEGTADGQFGAMTETAVKAVETELRAREQAVIDALPTPAPLPTPDPEMTPDPAATPAPTPEPAPKKTPATEVDGVVDLKLQIRLHSDEFPLVSGDLGKGSDAAAVARLQKRLLQLGCLTGAADGDYGANTRRGVRIFQHYNGLTETGVADEATQRRIFSGAAKAPANPLMLEGSEGDAVKQLQTRLILLGFMRGSADGSYGKGTSSGVRELQGYLREKEIAELTRKAQAERQARSGVQPAQPGTAVPANATGVAAQPDVQVTPTIEVNGIADPLLMDAFYADDFAAPAMKNGDAHADVKRLQRRLGQLEYLYTSPDGSYGNGTESAVRDFQKRNSLPQDGVAGARTLDLLFSGKAKKALKPYVLKVSIDKQRVYAYGLDENNEHTVLVRTMKASTGLSNSPTPRGTYQATTSPGARWHYFKKFDVWAQYAYYIEGDYLFHSVLYMNKGGSPTSSSVRNLGSRASHGCVRLAVEDAKWIYTHCPPNTKVVVY
ncbi:MAG: L,D-transpeptidase family protein [Eubacteriales bacterium]|nr:L,D-transpeptidase family protein [Christensenellaceae bacterium]MEA5065424.1 L,D-transpeptidase family protein [Eubacteriales bacterium]